MLINSFIIWEAKGSRVMPETLTQAELVLAGQHAESLHCCFLYSEQEDTSFYGSQSVLV